MSPAAVGVLAQMGHMEAKDTTGFCLQTRAFCKLYELRAVYHVKRCALKQ